MSEYAHTLIPATADFVPTSEQAGSFLSQLSTLGALPLKPELRLMLPGTPTERINPVTRKPFLFSRPEVVPLKTLKGLPKKLEGKQEYTVIIEGDGPPPVPAFPFPGRYGFDVKCCLRPKKVSTSDPHHEAEDCRDVELFGAPCETKDRTGYFHHPSTLAVITVPKAGFSRFWIEFEFGKSLIPEIDSTLELIEPQIVALATAEFGTKFIQGCHWSA